LKQKNSNSIEMRKSKENEKKRKKFFFEKHVNQKIHKKKQTFHTIEIDLRKIEFNE